MPIISKISFSRSPPSDVSDDGACGDIKALAALEGPPSVGGTCRDMARRWVLRRGGEVCRASPPGVPVMEAPIGFNKSSAQFGVGVPSWVTDYAKRTLQNEN